MKKIKYSFLILSSIFLAACEDKIDLDLEEGRQQLVVDGFLTNDSSIQTVRLTLSAAYFLNAATPGVNTATVQVIGPNNQIFNFQSDGEGNFNYDPSTGGALDSIGFPYLLNLVYNGSTYLSRSILNPVPPIDSMTATFEENELGQEDGFYTEFFARDIEGRDDFYWIKAFKNGKTISPDDPSSLILAANAAFGAGFDGTEFITPIRAAITNEDDPFAVGDTSSVELYSLNFEAYAFLQQVTIQANNGGLFATPPANIRSNIFDAAGNIQDEVLGIFSISAVSKNSLVIK